ncbi:hypothetical protein Tco_1522350 [Tanacetum coccineum]
MDLDFAADGNLRELSGEEAWEAIENFAQGQKEWDNPPNIIFEQVANLKAQAKRLFGNENVWVEMHKGITWDKVENSSPQSTPQFLPSFEVMSVDFLFPHSCYNLLYTQEKEIIQTLMFLALGWHLEEMHATWAHLEKKRTRLRLYTKYLKEPRIQSVETALQV